MHAPLGRVARARAVSALAACALLAASGCGSSSHSTGAGGTSPRATGAEPAAASALNVTKTPKYGAPPPSAPVRSGAVEIAYRNISIEPDTIKVKLGSTIRWTNYDPVGHNTTSESGPQVFASKDFGENGTFELKALKVGLIHYECTIHPASMNGTIDVVR